MWCHHLMMIVNQMWPTSSNTAILTNLTTILTKWRSLGKKASLTPKKVKFWAKKKVIPRIHLDMDFLQKTRSKMVKFGLYGPTSDLQRPIGGPHPMLYFSSQITKKYSIVLC